MITFSCNVYSCNGMEVHFYCIVVFLECMVLHSFMCESYSLKWIMCDHEFNVGCSNFFTNETMLHVIYECRDRCLCYHLLV